MQDVSSTFGEEEDGGEDDNEEESLRFYVNNTRLISLEINCIFQHPPQYCICFQNRCHLELSLLARVFYSWKALSN